ncbi:MAG TPA: hypothetical protein VGP68_16770 [Gemmataceae bacterium]|jgi:hypothetical protein|nr:hypothetical protein [Gemmataceae bacterium]
MSNDELKYTHIHDGFTRKGFINGINNMGERLSGELRFTYRPMLSVQRDSLSNLTRGETNPQKIDLLFSAALAKHLVDWSAQFEDGTPVPANAENVRRLPPFLYDRIYGIIAGMHASDPEPEIKAPDDDAYTAELRAAKESGAMPGDLAIVTQQKN